MPKSDEDKSKEKQAVKDLEDRIAKMDSKEKRKYEAEQKKKERMKEDLESERIMKEQIDLTKKLILSA